MSQTIRQMGFPGIAQDDIKATITGTFAQVKFVLEGYPDLRGRVGAVVVKVWAEFYGLEDLIRGGRYESVAEIMAGEHKSVPNYKTVSRNYHRVCKRHPELYQEPAG